MRNAPTTRPSLILRLKDRDDLDAWQEFAEIYQPLVFRLALQKGFQHSDAADVSQEVLLRVAGAIDRWDPDVQRGSFRGWLNRIARNLMINFLEKGKRHPIAGSAAATIDLIEYPADATHPMSVAFDEEFERQVFSWAAERVRKTVNESTWQAFQQTAVDDVPAETVAATIGITVGAVYVARSRVIQKLRREVRKFSSQGDHRDTAECEVSL